LDLALTNRTDLTTARAGGLLRLRPPGPLDLSPPRGHPAGVRPGILFRVRTEDLGLFRTWVAALFDDGGPPIPETAEELDSVVRELQEWLEQAFRSCAKPVRSGPRRAKWWGEMCITKQAVTAARRAFYCNLVNKASSLGGKKVTLRTVGRWASPSGPDGG